MTGRGEHGSALLVLPVTLVLTSLLLVAVVDITALFAAASRAQALADAAALAAVSVDVPGAAPGRGPVAEADRVIRAEDVDGWLERCHCVPGSEHAEVAVSVPIRGIVLPTIGVQRVTAHASAVLTPRSELRPPAVPPPVWRARP